MRTKGEADAALSASALDWTILRPGLVLSPQAYGGTAMLRALAAFPLIQPLTMPGAPVQCATADDVADAVVQVLDGRVASRRTYDLVEDEPHTLREIVGKLRAWLGIPPAIEYVVPGIAATLTGRFCDALGWLGWRAPLRTTAMMEIAAGVIGDPRPWREQTGKSLATLDGFLRQTPATVQEGWHARAFLLKPVVIGVLALFWIVTGLITFLDPGAAARVLVNRGMSETVALTMAQGGAITDIVLGLGVLHRPSMPLAAKGMIAVTLAYLMGGTVFAPDLWLDPLGPLVKAVPAMVLALVALAFAEDR